MSENLQNQQNESEVEQNTQENSPVQDREQPQEILHPNQKMIFQIISVCVIAIVLAVIIIYNAPKAKKSDSVKDNKMEFCATEDPEQAVRPVTVPVRENTLPSEQPKELNGPVQNPELIDVLGLRNIRVSKTVPNPKAGLFQFQKRMMRYPFKDHSYIVYAEAVPGNPAKTEIDLNISAVPSPGAASVSLRNPEVPYVESMLIEFASVPAQDEVIGQIEIQIPSRDKTIRMPLKFTAVSEFNDAPAQVKLCALLHAACDPAFLLSAAKRDMLLAEAEKLQASDYANDPAVNKFVSKIRRIGKASAKK